MSRKEVLDIVSDQFSGVSLRLESQLARTVQLQIEIDQLRRELMDMKNSIQQTQEILLRAVVMTA